MTKNAIVAKNFHFNNFEYAAIDFQQFHNFPLFQRIQ